MNLALSTASISREMGMLRFRSPLLLAHTSIQAIVPSFQRPRWPTLELTPFPHASIRPTPSSFFSFHLSRPHNTPQHHTTPHPSVPSSTFTRLVFLISVPLRPSYTHWALRLTLRCRPAHLSAAVEVPAVPRPQRLPAGSGGLSTSYLSPLHSPPPGPSTYCLFSFLSEFTLGSPCSE